MVPSHNKLRRVTLTQPNLIETVLTLSLIFRNRKSVKRRKTRKEGGESYGRGDKEDWEVKGLSKSGMMVMILFLF